MLKMFELRMPDSCWNKADMKEMLFVLLERDAAAPETIRFWAALRVSMGLNKQDDVQIQSALNCARAMEELREESKRGKA